jgi:hypothetical protein
MVAMSELFGKEVLVELGFRKGSFGTCFRMMGTTTDYPRAMANWYPSMELCRVIVCFNLYEILCHITCMLVYTSWTSL